MKKNIAGKIYRNKERPQPDNYGEKTHFLADLIAGCRKQQEASQETLYKRYYGYVLSIALTYCPEKEDALEVTNDSFMKVFKHIHSYSSSQPFKPWLRRIVVNTSIDRARSARKFRSNVDIGQAEPVSAPSDIEAELNARQIYTLLNELPDLLRFVFNMYEIEGYTHHEIAQKLGIAESSSRAYLTRAKARLRHLYQNFFMDEQ